MVMAWLAGCAAISAQLVVEAELLYPMTGDLKPIKNGVVVCGADGKIAAVGKKGTLKYPSTHKVLKVPVAMPGVIDAYATVGLSGILNSDKHDQEQLDRSGPIQPELRAVDAYNGRDPLVKWLRDLGVTTVNAGHAPGALVAGQAMVIKTDVVSIVRDDDPMKDLIAGAQAGVDAAKAEVDKFDDPIALAKSHVARAKTDQERKDAEASLTKVMQGNMVKVLSWYDNEWGFSNRMLDTAGAMAKLI